MNELMEFLKARLDEDGQAATLAANRSGEWRSAGAGVTGGPFYDNEDPEDPMGTWTIVYDEGYPQPAEAVHIARHDPARALRELAAKRAIVDEFLSLDGQLMTGVGVPEYIALRDCAIKPMAAIYSDHPDYQQEWAPR